MTTAESLRLDEPPVVAVRFTFHFDCSRAISLSDVTDFIAQNKDTFPRVSESRPMPPAFSSVDNDLLGSSTWPIPLVEMANPETAQAMHFQGDRFGIQWDFGSDEKPHRYPGYDVLSRELFDLFNAFQVSVGSRGGLTLTTHVAECVYVNLLSRIKYADYMLGYLTNWIESECKSGDIGSDSMFFNVHGHAQGNEKWPTWVQVESEDNSTPGVQLTVRAGIDVEEVVGETEDLAKAHQNATNLFLEWTSEHMRTEWKADV